MSSTSLASNSAMRAASRRGANYSRRYWLFVAPAALVVTAPVLLLTLLMPKEIVAGLTAGGVKGG